MLRSCSCLVWCLVSLLAARIAWAQEPPASGPPAPGQPASASSPASEPAAPAAPAESPAPAAPGQPASGDDLGDIAAALSADAQAQAAAAPAPADSGGGGGGGGGVLTSLNPDIALILDVAGAWFSDPAPLQLGGHDPAGDGFTLQQLELSIGKAVDPYFRFDSNIVFLADGVEVEEAYGTTLALPHSLQVRAGKFLTRFGRVNPRHPHAWDFVDQPLAIGRVFGGDGNRGVGAELSYLAPTPFFLELVASATDPRGEATARSFRGDRGAPLDSPLDAQATLAAKEFFELSPDWSLATGQSYAAGRNSAGEHTRTDVLGVDLYLKYRPITRSSHTIVALSSEWLLRRRQLPDDRLTDLTGYASLSWRFAQRWAAAARYELGTAAEGGAGAADYLDPEWDRARHRAAAALTFWPTEFSRLRAQGGVDLPGWRDDPIWSAVLALELSVGAHGAHKF